MIAAVDEFILFDEMQYTRRDWRNRNLIKTPAGSKWLTVPVMVKGKYHQKIQDTEIDGTDWADTHWKSIATNYRRARYFDEISLWLEPLYLEKPFSNISELNRRFIEAICNYLFIDTTITSSCDYLIVEGKTMRLVDLCLQAGGSEYISGPAAKIYLDANLFSDFDIKLTWFDYTGYPEYQQLWGKFTHGVTILDLLFNCGKNSSRYMRYLS